MTPHLLAVDLSLSCTGLALNGWTTTVGHSLPRTATLHERADRMRCLRAAIGERIPPAPAVIVVEGPSFSSNMPGAHERAGFYWVCVTRWLASEHKVAIVPPASLKKYATGKGNSGKEAMLSAAIRRLPSFEAEDNNSADAAWLYAMAADHYHGVTHVPQSQRAALGGVPWPEV